MRRSSTTEVPRGASCPRLYPAHGRRTSSGITGSPGAGKSSITDRPHRPLPQAGQDGRRGRGRSDQPVLRRRDPRRSHPHAGPRHRSRRLHPLAGHARHPGRPRRAPPPTSSGVLDAMGKRRDPRRDGRRRAGRDRHRLAGATRPSWWSCPAWATTSRRSRPASSRSPTSSSVNKADREGADRTARDLQMMLGLGGEHGEWLPPILKTVASREEGVAEVLAGASRAPPRAPGAASGEIERRRRSHLRLRVETILKERVVAAADRVLGVDREVERGHLRKARSLPGRRSPVQRRAGGRPRGGTGGGGARRGGGPGRTHRREDGLMRMGRR